MNAGRVLVTGATGQLGALIVKHLSAQLPPGSVVAGGRNAAKAPRGVEFHQVDYNLPASIAAAMRGITRVVMVSGNEVGQRVPQHQAVIDAALHAGVQLLGYTSILKAGANPFELGLEHRFTEEMLAASKLPHILLRNGWYTENYTGSAAIAIKYGVIQSASGKARFSTASRDDYAAGAAALVLRDDHKPGQAYELAGSSSFSKQELAELLSRKSGRSVVVQDLSEEQYAAALRQAGLPEALARFLSDSDAKSTGGWLFDDSRTLERVIGRPTTPLEQTLDAALAAAQPA